MLRCTRRAVTKWRTVQTEVSWFREEWAKPRGRNLGPTVAARGKRRSHPLPTKAIDEAVGERGSGHLAQGNLASIGWRVQCPADGLCPATLIAWACRTRTRHSAERAVNDNAPSHWISVGAGDRTAGTIRSRAGDTFRQFCIPLPRRSTRLFAGGDWYLHHPVRFMPIRSTNDPALKPSPVLPDGAMLRAGRG